VSATRNGPELLLASAVTRRLPHFNGVKSAGSMRESEISGCVFGAEADPGSRSDVGVTVPDGRSALE
jgi:hypothetical protein